MAMLYLRRTRGAIAAAATAAWAATGAHAQVNPVIRGITPLDTITLLADPRLNQPMQLLDAFGERVQPPPPPPPWLAVIGAWYIDDRRGKRAVLTPTELSYTTSDRMTSFVLDLDVHDRVWTGGRTLEGAGDPLFTLVRLLKVEDRYKLGVSIGASVPAGSDVSLRTATQYVKGAYTLVLPTGVDVLQASLKAVHFNEAPGTASAYASQATIRLVHLYAPDVGAWAAFIRNGRRGAAGNSIVAIGRDFAFTSKPPRSRPILTVHGECTVSTGGRCDTIEAHLALPF